MTTNDDLMKVMNKLVERLYGDLDEPYEEAAIPRLLRIQNRLDERIDVLEKDRVKIYTFTSIISAAFGWLANYFIHGKH